MWWVCLLTLLVGCAGSQSDRRAPAGDGQTLDKAKYLYNPDDKSCDGFPRLRVTTAPGTCLGMVLPKSNLVMPRTLVQIKGSEDFLLVDMGGWRPNNGALYLMHKSAGRYALAPLKQKLNMPHGLAYSPDGWIYIGETDKISRFHMSGGAVVDWQIAIDKMPRPKDDMHPLTQFTFDQNSGDLFVNVGAPSDHCFAKESADGRYVDCPEGENLGMGKIFRYKAEALKKLPIDRPQFAVTFAQGLRNSMAMAVSNAGYLVQGENGRDFPELEEPYEEINVISLNDDGGHYGWPYCYNMNMTSPEWLYSENSKVGLKKKYPVAMDCSLKAPKNKFEYQRPHALIPPHASPLFAQHYSGAMFPEWNGKLLMSWHGYQPTGHRLVAYDVDARGLPVLKPVDQNATFMLDQKGKCPVTKKFEPRGGMQDYAPYSELISGWDEVPGVRPKGAPVGFNIAHDGSIYIVEDRENRNVVRLARTNQTWTSECSAGDKDAVDPRIELLAWRSVLRENSAAASGLEIVRAGLVQKYCMSCHEGFVDKSVAQDKFTLMDFIVNRDWFAPGDSAHSKMYSAISRNGDYPAMPPGGEKQFFGSKEGDDLLKAVAAWIDGLPRDVDQRFARVVMPAARKIRDRAGVQGVFECGQVEAKDVVYLDPRPSARVVRDGWMWSKVYLLPNDSRLFKGKCAYPADGVFYLALSKN